MNLLTNFEDAASYLDWTVGVHGIQISFNHPSLLPTSNSSSESSTPLSSSSFLPRFVTPSVTKQRFSACYLPDVIPEQGWTQIEAIDSAINKAGWNGHISEELRRSVKLTRYQGKTCTVSWEEYVKWRKDKTGQDVDFD